MKKLKTISKLITSDIPTTRDLETGLISHITIPYHI